MAGLLQFETLITFVQEQSILHRNFTSPSNIMSISGLHRHSRHYCSSLSEIWTPTMSAYLAWSRIILSLWRRRSGHSDNNVHGQSLSFITLSFACSHVCVRVLGSRNGLWVLVELLCIRLLKSTPISLCLQLQVDSWQWNSVDGDLLFESTRRLWIQAASNHGVNTFRYLFTDSPPQSPLIIPKLADPNLTITGVYRDCLQPTVQDLLSKHILEQEAAIIEVGIKKIVDFQTDKVIRAHLSDVCSIISGTDAGERPKAPEICPLPVSQPNK